MHATDAMQHAKTRVTDGPPVDKLLTYTVINQVCYTKAGRTCKMKLKYN